MVKSLLARVKECEAHRPLDGDGLKWVRRPGGLEPVIDNRMVAAAAAAATPTMVFSLSGTTLEVVANYMLDHFGQLRHVHYAYSIDTGTATSATVRFFHRWDLNSRGWKAYPPDATLVGGTNTPPLYWCADSTPSGQLIGNDARTAALMRSTQMLTSSNHPTGVGYSQWHTLVAWLSITTATASWTLDPWHKGACRANGCTPTLWVSEDDGMLYYNGGFATALGVALLPNLTTSVWFRGDSGALPGEIILSSAQPTATDSQWVRHMGYLNTDADARLTSFRHLDVMAESLRY